MIRQANDDVDKLSRGKRTRARIGSRQIPHRLTQKERILFAAAQRQGFLKIPLTGIRPNVLYIYKLWCEAQGIACVIVDSRTA